MNRAYATLELRSVDDEKRTISGVASTPVVDRQGDVVLPEGAEFEREISLLLHHDSKSPVGLARLKRGKDAILFEASIPHVTEPGRLKDRVDEAWQSIRHRLIRGVSIGFRSLTDGVELMKDGGLLFKATEILELSLVSVPANQQALIHTLKSIDAPHLAASGNGQSSQQVNTPGASGNPVVRLLPTRQERSMKSTQEQINSFKSTRDQKFTEMNEIMTKSGDTGETLDPQDSTKYDELEAEVSALDKHLHRLESLQEAQKQQAKAVDGTDPHKASASRGGEETRVVFSHQKDEPGIGFAKAVLCKVASFLAQGAASPIEIAKGRYPSDERLMAHLKATIPAGTTTGVTWAAPFIDPANLASEFIDFLRPDTILGKFGTNGIPRLRNSPFNTRILGQTSGGDAYWVGEGAPKPTTKFDFNAITLPFHKVATIAVITKELARFSVPGAERIVRDSLVKAVTGRIDQDLLDPTQAAVTGVNPASLTNGLVAMTPSGTTADAARSDLARIIKTYLDNNNKVGGLVLVMPASLALSLAVMRNSLGQSEFPNLTLSGGTLEGIPVITSQYVANQSGAGNLVVAINADDVLLADDGNVTVDVSTQASIQMLDNPTNSSATGTPTTMVSLWQTNSIGLLAEREITWMKARAGAVVYMDDVNWGSIGSPA